MLFSTAFGDRPGTVVRRPAPGGAILSIDIVRKLAGQVGFTVLPRRWVVERTLAWISRCRRTVRDYERLPAHHATFVQWSMIIVMSRRLARHTPT